MKKTSLLLAALLSSGLLLSTSAFSDDDGDDDEHYRWSQPAQHASPRSGYISRRLSPARPDVAPVTNPQYSSECGSCHMAYPPGLLPARSWKKLMATLDNHFDENAELDNETQQQLSRYLIDNAADHSSYKRSRAIMRSLIPLEIPLRISKTRYFQRKHDELPRRVVEANPQVKSFSRCEVCHIDAEKGSYNEYQVNIPGYGQWND